VSPTFFVRRCPILVLSRKKNEAIVIAADIRIVIVEIRGDKCRLGIEAPGDVRVDREEVWVRIQREGKQGDKAA
jgi:carbon storage regulator